MNGLNVMLTCVLSIHIRTCMTLKNMYLLSRQC